ncbi:MAG: ribbon-helix-helix domain-containing protein [Nanoarchaeota archaeon]
MVTEMITVKLERQFLHQIDDIVKKSGYQNRTEFIRNALREKIDETKLKQAMIDIDQFRGIFKKKKQTTDKELHEIREKVFWEMHKKLKSKSQV